jgi:hypothetical protein
MAIIKLDILCFGAHPDDVELSCSGTVMRHIDLGYKVGVIDLTQGELGTRGSGELRLQEAEKASKMFTLAAPEKETTPLEETVPLVAPLGTIGESPCAAAETDVAICSQPSTVLT